MLLAVESREESCSNALLLIIALAAASGKRTSKRRTEERRRSRQDDEAASQEETKPLTYQEIVVVTATGTAEPLVDSVGSGERLRRRGSCALARARDRRPAAACSRASVSSGDRRVSIRIPPRKGSRSAASVRAARAGASSSGTAFRSTIPTATGSTSTGFLSSRWEASRSREGPRASSTEAPRSAGTIQLFPRAPAGAHLRRARAGGKPRYLRRRRVRVRSLRRLGLDRLGPRLRHRRLHADRGRSAGRGRHSGVRRVPDVSRTARVSRLPRGRQPL